jgi:organic hydroperoxide reductase OsmC/OhrA
VKTQNNYKCWLSVEKLEIVVGKYIMSAVTLLPTVVVLNEEDHEKAMQILRKSEAACLISNSIKSKIILEPTVYVSS